MNERLLFWKANQAIGRVLTTCFFDLKVFGLEHIPSTGGALIVSNHQSNLDPIVIGVRLRRQLDYIAKEELFEISPTISRFLSSLGGFPVRQGADIKALKESIRRLREGRLLNIYPEGSRTPDGEIGKIEGGVALIESRAKAPVIPAVIVGAYEAWSIRQTFPRSWPIRVQFGPPMLLADMEMREILNTIDRTLRKMYDDLRGGIHCNGNCDSWRPVQPMGNR